MIFTTILLKIILMLNYCYNFNAQLLFTDTDSFTYEIKSENLYDDFFKWKDLFDFSNYSEDSKFYEDANKNVNGKMKDEYGRVIIGEFVGLKSKMYSIKKIDGSESSTAKGVNIATEFNEFKDVLFNKKIIRHKMKRIQAKKHKISLSCFDDKRFVLDDGVHTLAYFHKDKKDDKNENENDKEW